MDACTKYCRSCGKIIPKASRYCRYCGYQYAEAEERKETAGGPSANRKTSAYRETKQKPSGSEKKAQKKRKSGGIVVWVFLVAILFTGFVKPGFFRKKEGGGKETVTAENGTAGSKNGKKIKVKKTAESAAMSSDRTTAVLPDSGLTVVLTPFILEDGQEETLSVESMDPVYAKSGDYVIKPYHVSLGELHELTDFVEIRIPYDTTFCDAGEDPAECVGGVYYNPGSGGWEETLYSIDAEAGEIVIETDHFSDFGAITVKNKGRRDAILSGGSSGEITGDEDLGYLDQSQAVSVMQSVCSEMTAETPAAKLAGNQVMQAAMALGGTTVDAVNISGAAFSLSYYLDLTDAAMSGNYFHYHGDTNYLDYIPGPYADTSVTYSNRSYNVYNNDLAKKSGEVLSKVGTAISGCKIAYLAGKAAMGKAEDPEIFDLYKEAASLAVSLSGSATLSALMGPVMLADTFINYMFTESMAIKESQIEEMYIWFNEEYPGSGAPTYTRPGRSAADWRKTIIKLIEENPGADTAELLETEVNDFCNAFWTLGSDELADVVMQMPKTVKRIPNDDKRIRDKLTKAYKKRLYDLLNRAVMPSVREYYNRKMILAAQKTIASAKRYYNQEITFDILEADRTDEKGNRDEKADAVYGGCRCCFVPLSGEADVENWSSILPEKNVGLHGTFTLIGHITAGRPSYLSVYQPDADLRTDQPVLSVPFTINEENYVRIILEEPEKEDTDVSDFEGLWYDTWAGSELTVKKAADGRLGLQNYGGIDDWIYFDYSEMPKGSAVTIRGTEVQVAEAERLLLLTDPECAGIDLPKDLTYHLWTDPGAGQLITIFGTQTDAYTRESRESTVPEISVQDYSGVIPPGGD